MEELLDAKTEFRNFFILLRKDKWFNSVSDYRQLDKINGLSNKSNSPYWAYNLSGLEFKNICLDRHIRPQFITKLAKDGDGLSKLVLSISCECKLASRHEEILDPIASLAAKFVIQFEYIAEGNPNDMKMLQNSWHLDKHDTNRKTETSHPLYHYEFGGTEITKTTDFNYGDFILIDAPRIMHPPLDIVLSIDFVIKNYYKEKDHMSLTNNPLYKRYVENAKHRVWRPYAIMFASNFHDFSSSYLIDTTCAKNIIHCS